MTRLRTRTALVVAAALALSGCAGSGAGSSGTAQSGETGTMTVLAASSLTEAFTALAKEFEAQHPHVKVKLAFDSSATLAEQVNQGAPADVLATADEDTMQSVVDGDGTDGDPQDFATNHLVLAVPKDNPAGIQKFSDLEKPGVKYVVCVDTAPCGKVAAALLKQDKITAAPASTEIDVKSVLAKVTEGEADAGIVYSTDAVAAGDAVKTIAIPGTEQQTTTYPIATLDQSKQSALAQQFVDLVLSSQGQQVLHDAGFGAP